MADGAAGLFLREPRQLGRQENGVLVDGEVGAIALAVKPVCRELEDAGGGQSMDNARDQYIEAVPAPVSGGRQAVPRTQYELGSAGPCSGIIIRR